MVQQQQQQQQEQDSIWYFKSHTFKWYIETIEDETITVESALQGLNLRELPCLTNVFRKMTVGTLAADSQLIAQLYKELRAGMSPPKNFKLPYKKVVRELELKQSLAEAYDIDIDRAKAKVVTGYYEGDGIVFPYAIEAVIAPRKRWRNSYAAGALDFIGYVNDSPAIDGGEKYFSGGDYKWENKKTGKLEHATSAIEILQGCGFDTYAFHDSKKRVPCIFLINLKTNVRQWLGSAGKTHISLIPFAKDIAELVSYLAYQMPTCHGMGFSQVSYSAVSRDEDQNGIKYLRKFLEERKVAVEANPSLKINDRLTQSGVWYRIRPRMIKNGFRPRKEWGKTRRTLTTKISDTIEELWPGQNLTREDLGIVASSKGVVLYEGEAWPINGDTVDALAEKGIAIIVIEKEGIADLLAPSARKYGIALAHTGGRFTNAIKKLIERAKEGKSVVRILTDYDAVGMDIAAKTTTPTIRIGIDKDVIKWLQEHGHPDIESKNVEEEYTPNITTHDEYLKTKRIELDNVQQEVGATKLWEYVMYRLQLPEFNSSFDITKVIQMPKTENLRPQIVKDVLTLVDNYIVRIIESREVQILSELEKLKELVEISKKENDIEEELKGKITKSTKDDEGMKTIVNKFKELLIYGVLPTPEVYKDPASN
jgi:hypothetical protein